jgi:hypothetical protein
MGLEEVPALGEVVRLVEIGTHCRGAIFVDGMKYKIAALEDAVEELARSFEGFYFGRFDLRAPSLEAFGEGDFKVLELNGVSSESTHIYDPKYRLVDAWGILCRQWRLAFEVGARNRARGFEPASLREVVGMVWGRRR